VLHRTRTSALLAVASLALLAACSRGEPPHWDGGPGTSLAVAPLPGTDAGAFLATITDASAVSDAGPAADASPPPASAPSGEESGKLPQTHDRPEPSGPAFDARVRALWDAIVTDDADRGTPFFFPLSAYQQVKGIANPSSDWKHRLMAHYARDIHALHAKLGDKAAHARFVAADVPMDRARWVEPNEEYNRLGYFRVYGTKLRGDSDGAPIVIDVTSLISWRGEWFCVHLTGVK
jgi:hypothetical protein